MITAVDRLMSKVQTGPGCWEWQAAFNRGGYGAFFFEGRMVNAHRAAYELLVGPVPADKVVDHLCQNKRCVNPAHLEIVTSGENSRRYTATITTCPNGHEYSPENTYVEKNRLRHCKTCLRTRARLRYQADPKAGAARRRAARQRKAAA